ncbi:hypothetical protein GW17_00058221 [Ensete ventricosum]|nr:hypothetical protein GW17_00058221 [Ensete ventricosum]
MASLQSGGTHRGAACGHDAHLPTRCRPRAAVPTAGAAARGKGDRQRCAALLSLRGSDSTKVLRWVMAIILRKRMILPI